MYLPDTFIDAFNHAMLYEVGPFWNPDDEDVIHGRIDTKEQRKKVGYVNIPADRGGETKYGIAQKANRHIDVKNCNLEQAMYVYHEEYWLRSKSNNLNFPLSIIHFDGAVNHGLTRAAKFLQRAAQVHDDGIIGSATLDAVNNFDQHGMINSISEQRIQFYHEIVAKNPSQNIFLNGWLRRINEVTEYCLNHLE